MQHKFVEGPYSELINYDTTLWQEESDNYLYRSIESSKGIGNLYSSDDEWSIFFKSTVEQYLKSPEKICDIGCSFGHAIHSLVDVFKGAEIIGIDPGEKAIKTAIAKARS